MEIKDFKPFCCGNIAFIGETVLWGSKTEVCIDGHRIKSIEDFGGLEFLPESVLDEINRRIEFIEKKRSLINKCMIDSGMLELAEDWASSAEDDEDDETEENCFIMDDGQKVYLPIKEEDFFSGMTINSIGIDFSESIEKSSIAMYINCHPDYFAGHSIRVFIDENDNIKCNGLAG